MRRVMGRVLYGLGHMVSKTLNTPIGGVTYPLYNRLMALSLRLDP